MSSFTCKILPATEYSETPDSLERLKARLRWIRETKPTDAEWQERLFQDEPFIQRLQEINDKYEAAVAKATADIAAKFNELNGGSK